MPVLKYRDPADGEFKPILGGGDGGSTEPPEPDPVSVPVPVGSIVAFGGSVAPEGWHICDGTAHGSAELQAVIGSANTPDLRGKFILGVSSAHPAKQTGGAETHTLTAAEMPSHTHDAVAGGYFAVSASGSPPGFHAAGSASSKVNRTMATGGNGAHNNMPPYYALVYIIKKADLIA